MDTAAGSKGMRHGGQVCGLVLSGVQVCGLVPSGVQVCGLVPSGVQVLDFVNCMYVMFSLLLPPHNFFTTLPTS